MGNENSSGIQDEKIELKGIKQDLNISLGTKARVNYVATASSVKTSSYTKGTNMKGMKNL